MPVAKILLLVFACKSKALDPTDVNVSIVSSTVAKRLKISPGFGSENSRQLLSQLAKQKDVEKVHHTLKGFASPSTPSLHPHFIQGLHVFMLKGSR
jgi:hypothetical protein